MLPFLPNLAGQQIDRYIRWVDPPLPQEGIIITQKIEKSGLHERSNIKSIYISQQGDSIIILTKDQGAFITSSGSREKISPFLIKDLANKESLNLLLIKQKLHVLLDNSELVPIYGKPTIRIPITIPSAVDIVFQGDRMFIGTRTDGVYVYSKEPDIGWVFERKLEAEKSELPSNRILDIMAASNGTVWIGTDSGLAAYFEGKIVNYGQILKRKGIMPASPKPPSISFRHEANKILEYSENRIFVGGKNGVYSVETSLASIQNVRKLELPYNFNMINDLYLEGLTKLWIAGDHLVRFHLFHKEVYDFNILDTLYKSERAFCLEINEASNEMWVGTTGSGVFIVPLSLPFKGDTLPTKPESFISNDTIFFSEVKGNSDFLPVDQFFIMQEVQFEEDDFRITVEGKKYLNDLVKKIKKVEDQYRVSNIEIRGHTSKDQRENEEGSRKLSQLRADMVKQFLIENGVSANKIYAKGYGNDFPNPVYSKDLIHPAHRRVEMKIALISREKK